MTFGWWINRRKCSESLVYIYEKALLAGLGPRVAVAVDIDDGFSPWSITIKNVCVCAATGAIKCHRNPTFYQAIEYMHVFVVLDHL